MSSINDSFTKLFYDYPISYRCFIKMYKTVGVFAFKRYFVFIVIDKILTAMKAEKFLSSHPGKSDKY